jgi:membrane associated rhomboid family serine protease
MTLLDMLGLLAVAAALGSLIPRGLHPRRWPPLAVAAVALGLFGHFAAAEWALLAAFACALGGVVGPAWLTAFARRRAARGDFTAAARLIAPLARFNPALADAQRIWQAAAAWFDGDKAPAHALITALAADDSPRAQQIRESLIGLTRDWPAARFARSVDLQARAHCELGEVDAGIETAARIWRPRMSLLAIRVARGVMLAPMAFAGEQVAVRRLGRLMRLPAPARVIWNATADAAAGETEAARKKLGDLLTRPLAPALRHAAEARLEALPAPPAIGPSAQRVIDETRAEIAAGALLRWRSGWRSPVTVFLLAAIAVGFALQLVRGDGDAGLVALNLGALMGQPHPFAYPQDLPGLPLGHLPADYWRLLAYGFLHAGFLHLAANAIAIAALTPIVARALGGAAALVIFIGGVIIGGIGISTFGAPGVTVGASAGAMALLAAVLVIALAHPLARRTRTGRALLRIGIGLVLVQSIFDALTPQISSAGHLAGGLAGLALTAAWIGLGLPIRR